MRSARLVLVRDLSLVKNNDATTGWKSGGNARLVSKICMSLAEDIVRLLTKVASGKCRACVRMGLVSCQR